MVTPQPNSYHCFVCGVRNPFGLQLQFFNSSPGEVTAETILPEMYQGYPGIAHGGVVAAILDEAAGRSHMGEPPRFMYTARLQVQYRKNVPIGEPLRLVGRVGVSKRRTATATSALYNQNGELLAEAEALLVDIPEKVLDAIDGDALGWRIFSQEELQAARELRDRSLEQMEGNHHDH